MEYALSNGLRVSAQPKLKALCPHCGTVVVAKCGSKKIWHWAHATTENCDPWSEPETIWHRNWKNNFGKDFSEIRIQKGDYYHVADVLNKDGIVFEFQNSPISSETIAAREEFYGYKMIWVINGTSFKKNFRIIDFEFIKDWRFSILNEFDAAQNYIAFQQGLIVEDWQVKSLLVKNLLGRNGFIYLPGIKIYYASQGNKHALPGKIYTELLDLYEKNKKNEEPAKGEFEWDHPRSSWHGCKQPVFIDFGEDYLYRVTKNIGEKSGEGLKIKKEKFIEKYCGNYL